MSKLNVAIATKLPLAFLFLFSSLASNQAWAVACSTSISPYATSCDATGVTWSTGALTINAGVTVSNEFTVRNTSSTFVNNGSLITTNGYDGLNIGGVTTFTNNGIISGSFAGIQGSVTNFVNNGTVSGNSNGFYNSGSISSFINTGTISGRINNAGVIGVLENSQGASSVLNLTKKLPTNYNIIITSATNYGQLSITSIDTPISKMAFGISSLSTTSNSIVGQTLTGVLRGFGSNLSTYISSGLTSSNGYTYSLTQQGSTGTWNLLITACSICSSGGGSSGGGTTTSDVTTGTSVG